MSNFENDKLVVKTETETPKNENINWLENNVCTYILNIIWFSTFSISIILAK